MGMGGGMVSLAPLDALLAAFQSTSGLKVVLTTNINPFPKVQWDGKDLEPGAQWTPTQVKDQPFVHWEVEEGAFYTMVMTGRLLILANKLLLSGESTLGTFRLFPFDRSRCTQPK